MLEFPELDPLKKEKELRELALGRKIDRLKTESGMDWNAIAAYAGVTPSAIARIVSGETKAPSFWVMARLADCFQMSLEELMDLKDDEKPASLLLADVLRELSALNNDELRDILPGLRVKIQALINDRPPRKGPPKSE